MILQFSDDFFHLVLPRKMFHRVFYFGWVEIMGIDKVNYILYVDWRLVGRCIHYVWLVVEVTVVLGIDERDATCGIFTVFQCLDIGDTTAMATETADGKNALVEHLVELLSK